MIYIEQLTPIAKLLAKAAEDGITVPYSKIFKLFESVDITQADIFFTVEAHQERSQSIRLQFTVRC